MTTLDPTSELGEFDARTVSLVDRIVDDAPLPPRAELEPDEALRARIESLAAARDPELACDEAVLLFELRQIEVLIRLGRQALEEFEQLGEGHRSGLR